jgi:protein-S-isoprenylcysteine O-methyltransferase Ste14
MPLREEFEKHGEFLFRWRSYLPILIVPLFALALPHSARVQELLGKKFDLFAEIFCFAVSLSGICVRCLTIGYARSGTSGRNTKRQRATVLNMTGMYSIVRHPLYLGNFLVFCGMLLFMQVWWLLLIGLLSFWLYYERIMLREEKFLRNKFESTYMTWANETPAFFPSLSRWQWPRERFSWKTVLRREYTGFLFVTAVFAFLENARDVIVMGQRKLDMPFVGLFISVLQRIYF